tara:strand:+ start:4415 stop:5044 length:630 start_codon:yes stop_codon:yes gene_type:complete
MWYWIKTPLIVKKIFHNQVWDIPSEKKNLYLTFDDGPTPGVTQEILSILSKYNAKATFFCIGKNVKKHPDLYNQIISSGNSFGNHSMTHPMGWGKSKKMYLKNIEEAEQLINSNLFRPPYGKINFKSNKALQKKYKIIMWDVVGGDFDANCSEDQLIKNITESAVKGSIIVLHDNLIVKEKTLSALPKIIEILQKDSYTFETIPFNPLR